MPFKAKFRAVRAHIIGIQRNKKFLYIDANVAALREKHCAEGFSEFFELGIERP
jgi:hypothetical protein